MASLIPHPPYAEDQPHARTLLTVHVSHRFAQTFAFTALPLSLARTLYKARSKNLPTSTLRTLLLSSTIRSTGSAATVGLIVGIPATFGRMRRREEIEWKDRTWRLLEHRGQVEVDGWSAVGSALGAVIAARSGRFVTGERLWRVVGGATMGNLAGVLGYLGWRYGLRGGRRED